MIECDPIHKICNVVHEPNCLRGGTVTAFSVEGTGPGAACTEPKPPPLPPPPPPKPECVTRITVNSTARYQANSGNNAIKGC